MKFSFSHFLVLAVTVVFLIPQASAQVVEIPDPNLRAVIRETLQIPAGEPITQQKITTLTDFYATGIPVNDLTGLEHAINVEYLNLSVISLISLRWRVLLI